MKYGVSHKENPTEYRRLESLERRRKNPIGYLLNQVKCRAKRTGKDYDLTIENLRVPTHCPIMGIPLFLTAGRRGPNSYSIDRVDNSKGYTQDNVRVISFLANSRKGDLTIEQVRNLLAYMEGNL